MHPILQSILPGRSAPRSVSETVATLAELQSRREEAANLLAVADAGLDTALIDRADGKVGGDVVARAAKAQRLAKEDYELATRAVKAATDRVGDAETTEANAAENAAWNRIEALSDERISAIEQVASALGYFAKAYRRVEELNGVLYGLTHAPDGRLRFDRDDNLITDDSLRQRVQKEIQRLEVNFFRVPPPYQELQPLAVEYRNVAARVKTLRQSFFS